MSKLVSHPEAKSALTEMFDETINYQRKPGTVDALSLVPDWCGKVVLDFGCGPAKSRERIEEWGAKWIGIDIQGSSVSVECDGHRLPFQENSFDIVFAQAVFEHLHNPFEAASEISRVCKPGGLFIGYVAFLEAFHMSYFHHSHKGIEYLLRSSGFEVTDILSGRSGIEHQFENLIFPRYIPYLTPVISRGIRIFLYFCKKLLYMMASVRLLFLREPRSMRRRSLVSYRTYLEVGYSGGLLFKGVKL